MRRRNFIKTTSTIIGYGLFNSISKVYPVQDSFDLIIKDGFIVDGSGKAGYHGDIGIVGNIIAATGNLTGYKATRFINADGLVITPGFIDVHSHSDDELLVNPKAESKIQQGVTTEIIGQDGKSIAPLSVEMQEELNAQYLGSYGIRVDWTSFGGYFKKITRKGIAVNLATMLGQGTLREYIVGRENRAATVSEVNSMQQLVKAALKEGALGISSGLEYTPGAFASSEELIQICKVMGFASGIYATHMRDEADFLLEALDEAIAIAQDAKVDLHISHLKCTGRRNWRKLSAVFERIESARRRGVSITMDRYPYLAYNTNLSSILPVWAKAGSHSEFMARLNDPAVLPKIKEETIAQVKMIGSWDALMITSVNRSKNKHLVGRRISEISGSNGHRDEFEFVRKLIIEEDNGVELCGFAMSQENTDKILSHPHCMVASDASARAPYGVLNYSNPHPRTYGTFPKFISEYVRERKLLSLPEAIRKMTSLPASRFGLRRRGKIMENYYGDLVIFDLENIKDKATFTDSHQYPDGIHFVLVNGAVVIEKKSHTGRLPGKILKRFNPIKTLIFK